MKLRTKLTLKYASITAAILLILMASIYYVSEHVRSETFFRYLRSEAVTKAELFLNGKVDAKTMQSIYLNNMQFIDEVEVAIYTPEFKIIYHDALYNDIIKENPEMIKEILHKNRIDFYVGHFQGIGMLYNSMIKNIF